MVNALGASASPNGSAFQIHGVSSHTVAINFLSCRAIGTCMYASRISKEVIQAPGAIRSRTLSNPSILKWVLNILWFIARMFTHTRTPPAALPTTVNGEGYTAQSEGAREITPSDCRRCNSSVTWWGLTPSRRCKCSTRRNACRPSASVGMQAYALCGSHCSRYPSRTTAIAHFDRPHIRSHLSRLLRSAVAIGWLADSPTDF